MPARYPYIRPLAWVLLLVPVSWLSYQAILAPELLGADPAKSMVDQTGEWALWMLLLALSITPLRLITRQNGWLRYRRLVGLFAFFYAILHVLAYSVFLLALDFARIGQELVERPYIIVGACAILLYIPLAITSTQGWQRRLKRNWVKLHRLVYVIGILAVIHITWISKIGLYETWPYLMALLSLFGIRLMHTYVQYLRRAKRT
ncbi:MAG: protein-methionine-sulfoxide reductase heme-binding subunit MsrQ [Pseudomonadota bacterium]|nr:protein-methionine-sulfoxide reductase heme-binding subunit MsrQ [Pseudomonadota bacterium]